MKLSDVMSSANLAVYAEFGLVLFLAAFVMVLVKVMTTKTSAYDEVVNIPFEREARKDASVRFVEDEK